MFKNEKQKKHYFYIVHKKVHYAQSCLMNSTIISGTMLFININYKLIIT